MKCGSCLVFYDQYPICLNEATKKSTKNTGTATFLSECCCTNDIHDAR